MNIFEKALRSLKSLKAKEKRTLLGITAALCAVAIISFVDSPSFIAVSAAKKQLPIYCVERDQKMVSISFDAAWGNDFCGNARKA